MGHENQCSPRWGSECSLADTEGSLSCPGSQSALVEAWRTSTEATRQRIPEQTEERGSCTTFIYTTLISTRSKGGVSWPSLRNRTPPRT